MVEDRGTARMHPDDLAALAEALRAGPVRSVVPPSPPDIFTGLDARNMTDMIRMVVAERVAQFVPADDIRVLIRDEVGDRLEAIGLPVDKDHIQETSEAVRGLLRYHKRADKVASGIILSVMLAVVYAVAKLIGINLPAPTGGG